MNAEYANGVFFILGRPLALFLEGGDVVVLQTNRETHIVKDGWLSRRGTDVWIQTSKTYPIPVARLYDGYIKNHPNPVLVPDEFARRWVSSMEGKLAA